MLKFLFRKIIGKEEDKDPGRAEKIATEIQDKSEKLFDLFSQKVSKSIEEVSVIREKSKDLEETNFKLGRFHLEKGNLREASFRFYLMTKFYPNNIDAQYELAYCYALREKYTKSQKTLKNLLKKQPNYDERAQRLLEHVNKLQQNR